MQARYHTTDLHGESLICPDRTARLEILSSLEDAADFSFPDVSLIHESGWAITVDVDWIAVLERVPDEATAPRILHCGSLMAALELWDALAAGKVETVLAHPWRAADLDAD